MAGVAAAGCAVSTAGLAFAGCLLVATGTAGIWAAQTVEGMQQMRIDTIDGRLMVCKDRDLCMSGMACQPPLYTTLDGYCVDKCPGVPYGLSYFYRCVDFCPDGTYDYDLDGTCREL